MIFMYDEISDKIKSPTFLEVVACATVFSRINYSDQIYCDIMVSFFKWYPCEKY